MTRRYVSCLSSALWRLLRATRKAMCMCIILGRGSGGVAHVVRRATGTWFQLMGLAGLAWQPSPLPFRTVLTVVCIVMLPSGAPGLSAGEETSSSLIDEVIAGNQANMALIQRGTATYRTTWRTYPSQRKPRGIARSGKDEPDKAPVEGNAVRGPFVSETTVYFDYPRLRFDWRGNGAWKDNPTEMREECFIYDGRRLIEYNMPQWGDKMDVDRPRRTRGPHHGTSNPNAHNVLIWPPEKKPARQYVDPRGEFDMSLERSIRRWVEELEGSVTAAREKDGLIRLDFVLRVTHVARWVAPMQGYCVVKRKSWVTLQGKPQLVDDMQVKLRECDNGAYVLSQRDTKSSRVIGNKILPRLEETVTLVRIDLDAPPDDNVFTLDGLDIPVGTKIQDRAKGRESQYPSRP